ncbi:MAG TPA: hypothetical protein VK589_02050 [Chryseolinea sp.]|nr:hypothetical protein [Chryseolinea sp.]
MNYYKRHWDETTEGELTRSWGKSIYYFETDLDHTVLRQIQVYENGMGLKYSDEFICDNYGGLSDQPLDVQDFEKYKIDKNDFEKAWATDYKK